MSEVKDMKSHVLWRLGKTPNIKETLKFHLGVNFNNFQERIDVKVLGSLLKHSHC